jgi:hypothetical protein
MCQNTPFGSLSFRYDIIFVDSEGGKFQNFGIAISFTKCQRKYRPIQDCTARNWYCTYDEVRRSGESNDNRSYLNTVQQASHDKSPSSTFICWRFKPALAVMSRGSGKDASPMMDRTKLCYCMYANP